MAEYSFFFSYARDDYDSYVEQFLTDLTDAVRGKLGLGKDDTVVFQDAGEIEIGQAWPQRLIEGLQHSKVMVCLYTPRYFKRPVCGKEVGLFFKREELLNGQETYVLPVYWIPCMCNFAVKPAELLLRPLVDQRVLVTELDSL